MRGIVAMEHMQAKYPDTFIGIAVHNNDAMAVEAYDSCLGLINWPTCNVDRTLKRQQVYPLQFEDYYNTESSATTFGKIDVEARFSADQKAIVVNTSSVFCLDSTVSYNVALVLLEDSVTGYTQKNAYAGGENGEMGGFESKPAAIKDQVFDHVARGIYPSYEGGTLCNSAVANTKYTFGDSITVPTKVQRNRNMSVVALLLEAGGGKIVNAARCKLTGGMDGNPNADNGGGNGDNDSIKNDSTQTGTHGKYTYVDLGLSVHWAAGNMLGADGSFGEGAQEAYGGYFGWADPTGLLTSSEPSDYQGDNPPAEISGGKYDLARAKWGGDWRLPTLAEMEELVNGTTTKADTINNVAGLLFTSKTNGNSIFMPANGSRYETSFWDTNVLGAYWTGTLSEDLSFGLTAHQLDFDDTGAHTTYVAELYNGFGIRPVFTVPTRINATETQQRHIVKRNCFTLSGEHIATPTKGIYLEQITYSDGTCRTTKRIVGQ